MRNILFAAVSAAVATAAVAQSDDPYLWLEDIEGAKALEQVKAWNAATDADLTKMPGFEERRQRALAILNDPNQIAAPSAVMGGLALLGALVLPRHRRRAGFTLPKTA